MAPILFEPVAGTDIGAVFFVQNLIECIDVDMYGFLDARKAGTGSFGLHPLDELFLLYPFLYHGEASSDKSVVLGNPFFLLGESYVADVFVHHASADTDLFFGAEQEIHHLLVLTENPADPDSGNAVGFRKRSDGKDFRAQGSRNG